MDVLVIGGSGLVGRNLVENCTEKGHPVLATHMSSPTAETSVRLDKTDREAVSEMIGDRRPDLVVDTAAFHAVDACETERERAWAVNAEGTANVARAADRVGAHLVYLSTDYVFPGDASDDGYLESDPVAPVNYYGQTKYAGEQAAKVVDEAAVLRSSVVYGLASSNFLTWALGELRDDETLDIVDDQVSCPTYAPDLARACLRCGERGVTGVYHAAGPASISRFEFTQTVAETLGYGANLVVPITSDQLGQEAPRPANSSLDSSQLYEAVDYRFRRPEAALASLVADL